VFEVLDEPELQQDASPLEFFYLWDSKLPMFELFRTLRPYIKDNHLPTDLLLALTKRRKLDLEDVLIDIPFILAGYLEVLYPNKPVEELDKEAPDVREEPDDL